MHIYIKKTCKRETRARNSYQSQVSIWMKHLFLQPKTVERIVRSTTRDCVFSLDDKNGVVCFFKLRTWGVSYAFVEWPQFQGRNFGIRLIFHYFHLKYPNASLFPLPFSSQYRCSPPHYLGVSLGIQLDFWSFC